MNIEVNQEHELMKLYANKNIDILYEKAGEYLHKSRDYFHKNKFLVEEIKKQNKEIERLNNIINTILDFNFFKEECPLNFGYTEKCDEEKAQDVFYEDDYCEENCNDDYKKCWLKYFERLQELKGE